MISTLKQLEQKISSRCLTISAQHIRLFSKEMLARKNKQSSNLIWRIRWKIFLPIALLLSQFPLISHAQSNKAIGIARATAVLIKRYDPKVRDVTLVVPASAGTPTACSNNKKTKNNQWEAYYCRLDRTIIISQKNLQLVESRYGLEAVVALVAHEFAHGRQHALTGFASDGIWTSVFDELQADCMAGVYMRRATPISFTNKQIAKTKAFLEDLGGYTIHSRDWHGTPGMRGAVFQFGYNKGSLDFCWASGKQNWRKTLEEAPAKVDKIIENAPEVIDNLINRGVKILDGR